jgi:hypothetical protein
MGLELTLITVTAVSLVIVAFGLAWIEASPRGYHSDEPLD